MSLPFTRATTFAEAVESEPQEAVNRRPPDRAKRIKGFTENSILLEITGNSSTRPPVEEAPVLYFLSIS